MQAAIQSQVGDQLRFSFVFFFVLLLRGQLLISFHFFIFRSPNAAALQGTSCGHERHCEGGLCVKKIEPGGESGDGGIFWERFSEASKVTTIATTKAVTTSTNDPGRVVYFPKTFNICQFFAQFGISLKTCES